MKITKNDILEYVELFIALIFGLWFVAATGISIFWLIGLI